MLVKLRGKSSGMMMNQEFNLQGDVMTFAWPIADTMSKLFNKIAPVEMVLRAVAFLVALVAAGSILASIYNSMNERRREIAILRALGARRSTIFAVVVLEASGIAALGAVAGFGVYFVIMSIAAWFIRQETGIALDIISAQEEARLAVLGCHVLLEDGEGPAGASAGDGLGAVGHAGPGRVGRAGPGGQGVPDRRGGKPDPHFLSDD